jgi:molybdopterin molybdotransferase
MDPPHQQRPLRSTIIFLLPRSEHTDMLDFDAAQTLLAGYGPRSVDTELVPLLRCTNRVLATHVTSTVAMPSADNSAMDGYAIRHADYSPGKALPLQGHIYAGQAPFALKAGFAIRVFTGSLLPENADTVVMQENVQIRDGAVLILAPPRAGGHIRRRGEDVREGDTLLYPGIVLQPPHIALIAGQGIDRVAVFTKVNIGILTTGDELVAAGGIRHAHQIYNSNGPMLATWAEKLGAQVVMVLQTGDDKAAIRTALETLLEQCDLVIVVGGASVGDRDFVKPVIDSISGRDVLSGVKMKPGKPVCVASVDDKPVVCLPGNPSAALIVSTLLVSPLIRRMQGRSEVLPKVFRFPLHIEHDGGLDRDQFIRVQCELQADRQPKLLPLAQQSPGALGSTVLSSGLARLPAGQNFKDGDTAPYYGWEHWLV